MKNFNWSGWTDWKILKDLDLSSIPKKPGAYIIGAHRAINRASGTDENGILDIGESDDLKVRITSFKQCSNGSRQKGHMAGWRFRNFNFSDVFPHEKLWVRWKECNSKEEAYILEGELLQTYISQHYELPPLNYKFNWSEPDAPNKCIQPTANGVG